MGKSVNMITAIEVTPELWASNIMPEGILENWLQPNGCQVCAGDPVAKVRVEDSMHELMAPAGGKLQTQLQVNSVIEPGTVIGNIVRVIQT